MDRVKYSNMSNEEIRRLSYENCPLKCTSCEPLCDKMPVGRCRDNLSKTLDKKASLKQTTKET
jgi:hypothetical protein